MRFFFKTADIEDTARPDIPRLEQARQTNQQQSSHVDKDKPKHDFNAATCPTPDENFGSWLKN